MVMALVRVEGVIWKIYFLFEGSVVVYEELLVVVVLIVVVVALFCPPPPPLPPSHQHPHHHHDNHINHLTISLLHLIKLPSIQKQSPPMPPPLHQNNHQYPTTTTIIQPPQLEPRSSPQRIHLNIAVLKSLELQHLHQ